MGVLCTVSGTLVGTFYLFFIVLLIVVSILSLSQFSLFNQTVVIMTVLLKDGLIGQFHNRWNLQMFTFCSMRS